MKRFIAASLLILAACSNFAPPVPTATATIPPLPTAAPAPSSTALPPTPTIEVLPTLVPEGQPETEWKGIPVMPGAISGEGDDEGYVFTIQATPEQIQEYYQQELGKLGWTPFAEGDGGSSGMLMFMNGASDTLTVSIITKGEEALVLLVK